MDSAQVRLQAREIPKKSRGDSWSIFWSILRAVKISLVLSNVEDRAHSSSIVSSKIYLEFLKYLNPNPSTPNSSRLPSLKLIFYMPPSTSHLPPLLKLIQLPICRLSFPYSLSQVPLMFSDISAADASQQDVSRGRCIRIMQISRPRTLDSVHLHTSTLFRGCRKPGLETYSLASESKISLSLRAAPRTLSVYCTNEPNRTGVGLEFRIPGLDDDPDLDFTGKRKEV